MTVISPAFNMPGQQLSNWLTNVGFFFDPFVHLDAGADPHLGSYLIMHPAFAAIWGEWPSLAFAPAGGGKTALRLQVMRACWSGPDTGHPFPVPYLPATDNQGVLPATLTAHGRSILHSAALQLFVALLLRPHWWEAVDSFTQRQIRGLLDYDLPAPLEHYLSQLVGPDDLMAFMAGHGLAPRWSEPPPLGRWRSLCDALATTPPASVPDESMKRIDVLIDVLVGKLGLSSVYLLVDGVDGFPETAQNPEAAIALIEPLLSQIKDWSQRSIFFKAFLPLEVAARIETHQAAFRPNSRRAALQWSAPSLAEVIRQRVFVATRGAFGSLDALSAPDLSDVETQIARSIVPLPREALVLTQRLLWEHVRRNNNIGKLDVDDLDTALAWYRDQRVLSTDPGTSELGATPLRKGE